MHNNEYVEITVLCMIYNNDELLLQNRIKKDWYGITFPGGHVEKNESFTNAVIREMKEETGLKIYEPRLCGIEQFSKNNVRYLILLYKTNKFSGTLISSNEGEMLWIKRSELTNYPLVKNFMDVLYIFDNDRVNELVYNNEEVLCPIYF